MNMQRYFLLGTLIAIMPNYVFGYSARYNQLVAEKQRKVAELEDCTGDVNGWKIAGISTIGLTVVGIAGNIALANTQSKYDDKIANTQSQINDTNDKINAKNAENSVKNATVVPVQNPQSDENKDNESLNQDIQMNILDSNPMQTSNTESMAPIASSTPGEQRSDCGNVGQKECGSFNYKVCEKDGQTKECTGDMLPRNATAGHCVSAGRKGYKICTATECDDRHDLSNGHCNTEKTSGESGSDSSSDESNSDNSSGEVDLDIDGTSLDYNDANMTWEVTFPYGNVSGRALCSTTAGSYKITGSPVSWPGVGRYCWCKATNVPSGIHSPLSWVFHTDFGFASDCADLCAIGCALDVKLNSAFRRAVFGGSGA